VVLINVITRDTDFNALKNTLKCYYNRNSLINDVKNILKMWKMTKKILVLNVLLLKFEHGNVCHNIVFE
jgi:hypothetical protein